jgi:outer membrane protein OmpA-like peptidoglycan-associated protein
LRNVAAVIKNHPEVTAVVVEGHTDNQGSAAHNKDLSQRRAEAVMLFLTQNGVDRARLRAAGFGPDRPIMDNRTKAGRAANRRVEFRIDGAKGDIRDGGAPPPAE